jgi:hypothetical protein
MAAATAKTPNALAEKEFKECITCCPFSLADAARGGRRSPVKFPISLNKRLVSLLQKVAALIQNGLS